MSHIVVLGTGITGVTSDHTLRERGHQVTVLDRHRYPAMETSFANGGQVSACNAEVWNNPATIAKGLKWVFQRDAPLLLRLAPSWHKYSWFAEFIWSIRNYRENTIDTTRLAIAARQYLFAWTQKEKIEFDLEQRGILHIFHDKKAFEASLRATALRGHKSLWAKCTHLSAIPESSSYAKSNLSVPSFSIRLMILSPAFSQTCFSFGIPMITPSGVPVKMISPGSSANSFEA